MLRPALLAELEHLSALARRSKAHWGYSESFMQACAAELTVVPELLPHVFVEETSDGIVGFHALRRVDVRRAELEFLFVEPRALRRGHGAALLNHARALAHAWGCDTIEIQGDPHAAAFYVAAGAVQVGERASASIPGRVLPLYELAAQWSMLRVRP